MSERADKGIIIIPPGIGTEPELPADQIHELHEQYLSRKYNQGLREGSKYRPGETPEEFFQRVLELYPDREQQNYILALKTAARPAAYGPYALQGFAEGQELDPKILQVYPSALNGHIIGKGLGDESLWKLVMDREAANEVIRTCNVGAATVKAFGNRKVKESRQLVERLVLGKTRLENASLSQTLMIGIEQLKVRAASKFFGSILMEQMIRAEIERLITANSLELSTDRTSRTLKEIAEYVGQPFEPIQLLADTMFPAIMALDNMNIHPDVGHGAIECFDKTITKPPILPEPK